MAIGVKTVKVGVFLLLFLKSIFLLGGLFKIGSARPLSTTVDYMHKRQMLYIQTKS